jgi:hypothetical protein
MTPEELQTPPTAIEIAGVMNAVSSEKKFDVK